MQHDHAIRFLAAVKAAYREDRPVPGCAVRRLTQNHVAIAHVLVHWRSSAHPSHSQLAFAVRVSVRTVRNALDAFRALGLLSWTRRVLSICGWRAQLANAYRAGAGAVQEVKAKALHLRPAGVATSGVLEAARALIGRYGRPGATLAPETIGATEARQALAKVAREREEARSRAWLARRGAPA